MSETDDIRASDSERQQVVTRLSEAVGEGRLTLAEFSDRAERAHAAVTRGELAPLTDDLPTARTDAGADRTQWHIAPIGGVVRRGRWRLPRRTVNVDLIGGARLDLSEAEVAAPEVLYSHFSLIGGISATVPRGVRIVPEGFSLIGGRSIKLPEAPAGAPTIRLRLFSIIGGISVSPR